MTRIHSGALLHRPPGPKYAAALDFAELALPSPLPTARTLRRWRQGAPPGVALALVVPREATSSARGALRFDEAMEEAFARTREAAEILGARFAVLETRGEVTTGRRARELLAAWAERWAGSPAALVWQPTGLWDPELARPFARELGVIYGFDPLALEAGTAAALEGPTVYARLRALGSRKRFHETLLLEAVDTLEATAAEDAYVAIDSPASFSEARRLAALAALEG